MTRSAATAVAFDPTVYPVTDDMAESLFQKLVILMLLPLVRRWLHERGVKALVGANQFIYGEQFNPKGSSAAPDLYVLPGLDPDTEVTCWKVWETGLAPSFALEVVSRDIKKDYEQGPERYNSLRARELIIFDRDYAESDHRVRWQVWRRTKNRGLVQIEHTNDDRVFSKELGCWLRAVGDGVNERVRIATGVHGDELIPTAEEREVAERTARLAAEQARLAAERAREDERRLRLAAEDELTRLREELERLKRAR